MSMGNPLALLLLLGAVLALLFSVRDLKDESAPGTPPKRPEE